MIARGQRAPGRGRPMVEVTRLDGKTFYGNPHQIEYVECNPDTTLVMLSGKHLVVRESYDRVLERIVSYRRLTGPCKSEE